MTQSMNWYDVRTKLTFQSDLDLDLFIEVTDCFGESVHFCSEFDGLLIRADINGEWGPNPAECRCGYRPRGLYPVYSEIQEDTDDLPLPF